MPRAKKKAVSPAGGPTKLESVSTDALIPYAGNSRSHSEAQVSQIAASIREFGFLAPIIVTDDDTILAGHGRLLAAQKLGLKKVPIVRWGHLTEAQRRAYIIADNKLTDNSQFDFDTLSAEFAQLADLDFDLELTGFTRKELDKMMGAPTFGDAPDEFPDDDGGDNNHVCPQCGYEWR